VQQKAKRETEKQRLLDANRRVYEQKVAAEEAEIAAKEKEASHFAHCTVALHDCSIQLDWC
jgi:predicted nucleotidyltransferase